MTSGCGVASSSCGLCASLVNSALLSVASCIPDIRITGDELIAERVFPKRQASAIEHKIFLETIGHVGLSLYVAIAAACRATATASENWPLSAQAAASVRRNRGSLPPESCTASWANPTARAPLRIDASGAVANTQAMLLREWGSSGAKAKAVS